MERKPLISVITVTYNAEKEIDITLDSLKSQSFSDFEHIVVDGASKDSTLVKIRSNPLPLSRILSESDKGLYDAMNKGLRMAKGEYVIFLNAGDAFFDSSTLAMYAQKGAGGADIIYGDTCIVDPQGNIIGKRHLSAPDRLDSNSFSNGMLICHQAFMVKKSLTEEYDTRYRFSADYDWCVKCIKKADTDRCVNLGSTTVRYLQAGMTDKNKIKSLRERFRIMAIHYGLPKTMAKHAGFVWRALRRGKL